MSEAKAGVGHNVGGVGADRLRSIVERYERLDEEVKAIKADQKDILKEAESAGYVPKVLRQLIRIRATDPDKLKEFEDLLDVYRRALGV